MKAAVALLLVALALADARQLLGGYGHDHDDCKIVKEYSCDPKDPVKCGDDWCGYPHVCATIKKEVVDPTIYVDPSLYDPAFLKCDDPKLLCHEILKPCGDPKEELFCKYNEKCVTEKVCKKNEYWEVECVDVAKCVEFDPKVCKVVEHFACVKKDPVVKHAGYYLGYSLDYVADWAIGEKCGDTVCDPGSTCASCLVEVCDDVVIEAEGEKCGDDSYCDPGAMCIEICDPAVIKKLVEVEVCLDPKSDGYWGYFNDYYGYGEACGDIKCEPGYKCVWDEKKVCDPKIHIVAHEDPKYYKPDPKPWKKPYGGPKYEPDYEPDYKPDYKPDYEPDYDWKPTRKPEPKSGAVAKSTSVANNGGAYTDTYAGASGDGKALALAGASNGESLAGSGSLAEDGEASTGTLAVGENAYADATAVFEGDK